MCSAALPEQLLSFVVGSGHVALVTLNTSCRNTYTDLDTPAAAAAESSTRITNENVPGAVGLPVVLPPDDRARPGGSAPELIVHLYGFTPPAAPEMTVV